MPIQEGGTFSPDRNIVSPGVFTRENDVSGVAAGVANIGGAVVAPFAKGPAYSPIILTDVNTLANMFGNPDGVYYGPYTAAQYLQEQGIVTICRVGGLTGYQQNYPFAIWAVKGEWNQNESEGSLNSNQSYVYFSGSINNPTYSYAESTTFISSYSSSVSKSFGPGNFTQSFSSSFTQSILSFNNPTVTITFEAGAADNTALNLSGSNANSGSILYYGQTVSLGAASVIYASASMASVLSPTVVTTSVSSSTTYLSYGVNAPAFSASIVGGVFSATFVSSSLFFPSGVYPWGGYENSVPTTLTFISSSLAVNLGTCGFPIINLTGIVTGTFGNFNGTFTSQMPSFNPCILPNGAWTGSGDMRLLAVLADTEAGGLQNLVAPGFYGSTLSMTNPITGSGVNAIPFNYSLTLKNSNSNNPYGVYQFSINSDDPSYITNVFGNVPTVGNPATQVAGQKIEAAYLYSIYEDSIAEVVNQSDLWMIVGAALPSGSVTGAPLNFTDQYSFAPSTGDSIFSIQEAITPWVISQAIASYNTGSAPYRYELFRIHTIADGTYTNTQFKVQISNVKLAGQVAGSDWGSFTLTLRQYSDTDKRPVIVEQYNNLNLNPDDPNYIARIIGDMYSYINYNGKVVEFGTYQNNSQNIRVEMTTRNYPVTAIPYGFEAYITPTNGAMGYWTPTMKYTKASVYGLNPGKYPSGITFDDAPTGADAELFSLYPQTGYPTSIDIGAADNNEQYFAPIPSFNSSGGTYSSIGRNTIFALDLNYTSSGVSTGSFLSGSNAIPTLYDPVNEPTYIKMRNFIFGFQGGFDGQSPAIPINVGGDIIAGNTQGLDCTTVSSAGSIGYNQAITALGNADQYDINLIVTPGIIYQEHPYVTNLVVDMCEARGDTFYIMDLYVDEGNPADSQISQVVGYAAEFDTNYAASYYPWVKILDTYNNLIVTVPPSVVLPAVYANNDSVAAEWFAPAGLNRGGISTATQVTDRTTHEERDTLYEGKVNPIAAFPGSGIVVWGQKTLQNADSALNRINVRRLLINIKKFFASTSNYLVFEQNVAATRNKFLSIVNPYLESVQQRSGLYAFFVKMDDTNNTADIIDQNILYGQIYLKPTKTAEFIILDFNILPTGASFPNA
jgi:hypothetical protein